MIAVAGNIIIIGNRNMVEAYSIEGIDITVCDLQYCLLFFMSNIVINVCLVPTTRRQVSSMEVT